ncbi:trimethylamine methyltransferase family protein [bacterium]|nr:trimethylamine methyltransferase family protein [bacterium]
MLKGFTRRYPPLEMLSAEEMESIHRGALYTLEKTGMRIEHAGAQKLLGDAGCSIDAEAGRVRFPTALVEECLRSAPTHFRIRARDPEQDVMVGGDTFYFMQGMGMKYVDLETWELRPATADEHRDAMIVADALPNTHLAEAWEIYTDRVDIPPVMAMLENLASGIRYSSKAQVAGNIQDSEIYAIQMAQAVGIDLFPEIEHASPLTIGVGGVDAAFRYMDAKMPMCPALGVAMGAQGPATIAGSLVLQTAETMGWAVLTQLYSPGAPIAIHHGAGGMDMRTGIDIWGGPATSVSTAMLNQILRRYGIPSWSNAGFASDSKTIDFQAGFEKSTGALMAALSGGQLQLFQGGSSTELLYSPALSVMDDDVAGWIGRVLQGARIDDETMAVDVINDVGPIPGQFLSQAHTREWWNKEDYFLTSTDHQPYSEWVTTGKQEMLDHARDQVEEILATHTPMPLTADQESGIEDALEDARSRYRGDGAITDEEWSRYMRVLDR